MIDVAEARRLAGKRLLSRMAQWAGDYAVGATGRRGVGQTEPEMPLAEAVAPAGAAASSVVEFGLKPPTEKAVLSDLGAAEAWAREWRAAELRHRLHLDWQSRAWPAVGRQDVPARVRFTHPDDIADFVGGAVARDWRRLSQRARVLRARWPQARAEDVVAVVRARSRRLLELGDAEFAAVVDVVGWLAEHRLGTMRPRQLPIRGVDSKWFGTYRGLVAVLLPLADAAADLDILDAEANVRIRILDPALAQGPLRDLAAPVEQLAALTIRPQSVLIFENLESVLALPDRPGVVAIHGSGYGVDVVARLGWVTSAKVFYWGDLDSHGFAILARLRGHLPEVRSLLMDEDVLVAHRDLWVPEPKPHTGTFSGLTGSEQRALDRVRAEGDVRLEQERIPWDTALAVLDEALSQASDSTT